MCVVSMVFDHYGPRFRPYEGTESPLGQKRADIQKLIEDFRAAASAAKKVDALTAQPDCEDPEKAKLLERVAELEKRLGLAEEDHFSRAFPGEERPE